MTQIKNYNYDIKEISAIVIDTYISQHLWIAYKQDDNGICLLRKVSANDPSLIYYDVEIETNEIKKLFIYNQYLYIALDDDTYFGKRYSVGNPLTASIDISIPAGITEAPIDILQSGGYIYFLTPGNLSGTNAKIIKFNTSGVYQSTIDLTTVQNANSFCAVGTEFWVTTYTSPSQFIRVYQLSGGAWTYTINT